MSEKAAIMASYADFKIIKTRQVCQMILEVPLERAESVVAAFGLPQPAKETYVAVARLQTPAKEETPPTALPVAHRPFPDLPYPQQAALRCQDMSFRDWLREFYEPGIRSADDAAKFVREHCGVTSRADIRPGTNAADSWERLNTRYTLWESARAA
jgi:hypothetical protein